MKLLKVVFLIAVCYTSESNSSEEGELPAGFVACKWDRKAYDKVRRPKYIKECDALRVELVKQKENCKKFYQSELGVYIDLCPSDNAYSRCLNEKDAADPFFQECGSKWDDIKLTRAQLKSLRALYNEIYRGQ